MFGAEVADAILTGLWTVIFLIPLFLFLYVMFDALRRKDLTGWAIGGWIFFALIVPIVGFVVYVIVRHNSEPDYGHQGNARQQLDQ